MRRVLIAVCLISTSAACVTEAERRQQYEQEQWRRWHAAEAARRAEAARQQERDLDRWCLMPGKSEYQANWCAAREREKDRAAQREQWERENGIRQHQLELQQQEMEIAERQRRAEAIRAIGDAYQAPFRVAPAPAPAPPPVRNCTSYVNGQIVQTTCF